MGDAVRCVRLPACAYGARACGGRWRPGAVPRVRDAEGVRRAVPRLRLEA